MLQLELGEDVENHVTEAAQRAGVTVDAYVRDRVAPQPLRTPALVDAETLKLRREAIQKLMTFAKDHNVRLPDGVTVDDLRRESRP